MATTGATNSQEEGVFATSRATSGSTNVPSSSSTTTPGSSSSSTSGASANNSRITLTQGAGLSISPNTFTLNQSADEELTIGLAASGVTAQTATVSHIQSITVNAQGQITALNLHSVAPTTTFNPGESNRINVGSSGYSSTSGGGATGSISTSTTTLMVETDVDTGFTVDSTNYRRTGGTNTDPNVNVSPDGTVSIPPSSTGTVEVGGEVTITGPNSMGLPETETVEADPVVVDTFIPYFFGFMATETTLSSNTGLTQSDSALTSGDQVTVVYSGSGIQYAYIALPSSISNPVFAASLFTVTPDDGGGFTYAGQAYTVYRFPSRGNFVVNVTF